MVEHLKSIDRFEEILEIVKDSSQRVTHILYKTKNSYVNLIQTLDAMIEMNFIVMQLKPYKSYSITENGRLFLKLVSGSNPND